MRITRHKAKLMILDSMVADGLKNATVIMDHLTNDQLAGELERRGLTVTMTDRLAEALHNRDRSQRWVDEPQWVKEQWRKDAREFSASVGLKIEVSDD